MRSTFVAVAAAVGLLAAAAPARADGFIIPSIGVVFGGDAGSTLANSADNGKRVTYGLAIGGMSAGVFGFEEDLGFTPDFFGEGLTTTNTRVFTAMSNLIIGIPIGGEYGGGIRPYAAAGLGLIHRHLEGKAANPNFSSNDFGYNLGLGVNGYFSENVGIRVDWRYFRNFKETGTNSVGLAPGGFNFNRASFGIVFRF